MVLEAAAAAAAAEAGGGREREAAAEAASAARERSWSLRVLLVLLSVIGSLLGNDSSLHFFVPADAVLAGCSATRALLVGGGRGKERAEERVFVSR